MPADSPILIVDDEPHIRRVAELSMLPLGRRVLTATDGRQAIDLAMKERPCVILLDHIMPVMDGKEALAELKSHPDTQDIPVVIFSARGQLALGQYQGFENAALFVTKPFSPSQLRKEIQRLLEPALSA